MTTTAAPAEDRILIVDDTPTNLQTLSAVLRDRGYALSVATSGRQALDVLPRVRPALILLDVMMPGLDGFETCRLLKAAEEWRDIPVIFLTAKTETADIVQGFERGAVDYIAKPFNTHELLARVSTHLALRRQQRELQESYRRLSELERLRDNLVHMVVHDLRSPLLGLSGCLQMLQADLADRLAPEQAEDLTTALAAAQRLSTMVTSLLDVSRLEAGQMPLQKRDCNLHDVLSEAVASLGGLTHGRHVTVAAAEGAVSVHCDPEVVGRVVANLTANALKFAPAATGAIRLAVHLTALEAKVTVADNGPGIPPEYRERIFEKFGQVEGRQEGRKHSTGLGLTFCKLAVEAHGGKIGVDSVVGQGSTFWFTLPLRQ